MSSISVAVEEAIGFDIRPALVVPPLQSDEDQEKYDAPNAHLGADEIKRPDAASESGRQGFATSSLTSLYSCTNPDWL